MFAYRLGSAPGSNPPGHISGRPALLPPRQVSSRTFPQDELFTEQTLHQAQVFGVKTCNIFPRGKLAPGKVSTCQSFHLPKFPLAKVSSWQSFLVLRVFLGRASTCQNFPLAKFPPGNVSIGRRCHSAKFPSGQISGWESSHVLKFPPSKFYPSKVSAWLSLHLAKRDPWAYLVPSRVHLRRATYVQHTCNIRATYVQHTCNIRATCGFLRLRTRSLKKTLIFHLIN